MAGIGSAILGLKNPGAEFEGTRHNVGGAAVVLLAERLGATLKSEKGTFAKIATVSAGPQRVVLAVSETFMNDSGRAAAPVVSRFLDGDASRLVVVHDELDLAPGVVRIKVGGGTAGHNGLRSLEQHLHRLDFIRVRIGIGKPQSREQGAKHVLSRPSKAEVDVMRAGIDMAADAVELICEQGAAAAMTIINARE